MSLREKRLGERWREGGVVRRRRGIRKRWGFCCQWGGKFFFFFPFSLDFTLCACVRILVSPRLAYAALTGFGRFFCFDLDSNCKLSLLF